MLLARAAAFLWMAVAAVGAAATSPVPTPSVAPAAQPSPIFDLETIFGSFRFE